ncbi:MAG: DEAD/DEAH box helicase [Thermoproteota archaeon]
MQLEYFEDLPLSPEVMNGIEDLGFNDMFPIQAEAIIPLLEGRDVIGQAKTGTGKTAAFGIPMVERLNPQDRRVQAIVLEPTRELAKQVAEHIGQICKYIDFEVLPIYGGKSIRPQIRALKRGVHIVVGTPGRIIDHLKRGTLNLSGLKVFVLDEADRMLDMGFIHDIEYILSKSPSKRQTSLFSATINQSVMKICNRYMKNPEKILVSKDEIAPTAIDQYYLVVNRRNKFGALCHILDEKEIERAIIFCKTRRGTSKLAGRLRRQGYHASPLHGGFSQAQRERVSDKFRTGRLQLLVATNVAARGIDIQGITHIINYDIPLDAPVYFHRIGRTGRMGQKGTAITLVGYGELTELNKIKALTDTRIQKMEHQNPTDYQNPTNYRRTSKRHQAVCTECGKECTVPFKPDPNRPVYCRSCWAKRRHN